MPPDTEPDSIRADIAASMQELGGEPESPPPSEPEKVEAAPESEAPSDEIKPGIITGDRERDEKGRFKPKQEELKLGSEPEKAAKEAQKPPVAAVPEAPKAEAKPPAAPPAEPAAPAIRPPQSWKPVAREEWSKVPPTVQQEIQRREREISVALQESASARQGYQQFKEAVSPFEAMIRAEGSEPVKAVQNLLQTAYALRTAPLAQRAAMLADLTRTFLPGQEGIQLLDQALSGSPQTPSSVQQQPQVYRDPRLDQLLAQVEEAKQVRVQALDQQAAQALSEVEGQEFYEDVREDMADILEFAAKRNLQMTPMDAYNRAVQLNPEVAKVFGQREAAKRAASPNGPTQRARIAASSVKSTPANGIRAPQGNGSLRDDLEEVVRELSDNRSV